MTVEEERRSIESNTTTEWELQQCISLVCRDRGEKRKRRKEKKRMRGGEKIRDKIEKKDDRKRKKKKRMIGTEKKTRKKRGKEAETGG